MTPRDVCPTCMNPVEGISPAAIEEGATLRGPGLEMKEADRVVSWRLVPCGHVVDEVWFDEEGNVRCSVRSRCPGCEVSLPEADLAGQARHMTEQHPEIVEERRRESARWDGWEQD